jgi:hypothetical protein
MQLKHVQSLALDFKFYITQRFNIWLNQLYVNYKSYVYQPSISMYHTKVLKTFSAFRYLKNA